MTAVEALPRPYAHDFVLFLEPPLEGQVLRVFATEEAKKASGESSGSYDNVAPENIVEGEIDKADLITSEVKYPELKEWYKKPEEVKVHKPVLDIDFDAKLIPSTTEGHFHLYLDKEIPWNKYVKLLSVLAEVGIIEEGFAKASINRGYSAVRLPWIEKVKA